MTDNKLTDEQIIKALETHIELREKEICTPETPLELLKLILDLINRQKEEIERLNKEVDRLTQAVMHNDAITEMLISEARKEFAKRSKKKATYYRCRDGIKYAVSISDIDNLLKEMDGVQ